MGFWDILRASQGRQAHKAAPFEVNEQRIVLVKSPEIGGSDFLSDSQSGEIYRIFERDEKLQIDAVPIVRRLLGRDITARNVALMEAPSATPSATPGPILLGLHFVLDERTRHIYRVTLWPRCCLAERLWGDGLDEVRERPLGGPLFSWCDLYDEATRGSLAAIAQALPESPGWGLRFASLKTEARSDVQRRLFTCALGQLSLHERPAQGGTEGGTEGAIEIGWQGRILLTFKPGAPASGGRAPRATAKVRSEAGELPF